MSANMFSRRVLQATTRRLAVANPSTFSKTPLSRLSAPVAIATGQHFQYRQAATTPISQSAGTEILAEQRRHRPVSPHLSIYQPQITWYMSMFHRITGATLSAGIYAFGAAYLVAPLFGWHLESATLAASFASLPIFAKIMFKTLAAYPFTYHSWNGIRHLVWDTGAAMTNKQVIVTGWTTVGLATVTALALVFM
ncbi:cytochrome b subunit of succinate dehydrogenase, Sdh3p [Exophiala xenobiotica]|uniref:Cytochrome b subunit of succinate dehydrogenase, Sdh3p n=1 Tax=Vermiconidia calcicola TaxID=1690605 RepID=A0AAV9Q2I8_9PEZI|nr:cytochrome b subunit of succinate dehydrogenase, Sdh3p [Exophiala xenobiotica]KAK5532964.1 cytochrome b subunit of succinate dehydrogenase, Sdh3p [Vermiconidia calcicola]KAK5546694.1 cytochrome b subunit of succinate dehydrogenase, Sdh3p [Chaetothyriales sp. CCFEE 6169]KAK5296933.1 cytochrome b subunit of succinate dehydrogenase, Sdh3p [Exophiala xenobiotica]KAK5340083.1 cytochrome b subunit of succinate dehydrogenase, Sdh3p [Exophiala xenobiotica]